MRRGFLLASLLLVFIVRPFTRPASFQSVAALQNNTCIGVIALTYSRLAEDEIGVRLAYHYDVHARLKAVSNH
jgi:hypothetical protein